MYLPETTDRRKSPHWNRLSMIQRLSPSLPSKVSSLNYVLLLCITLSSITFHSFIYSFIHSFITKIYIEPLQGYYSEALPILARLKGTGFSRMCQNELWGLRSNRSTNGNPFGPFHTEGSTTKNARVCLVDVRAKGGVPRPGAAPFRWTEDAATSGTRGETAKISKVHWSRPE